MSPIQLNADPHPVRIGARLRASRLAQGLTLEQLAQAAGLTKGFISRIERDDTMPSVPTLVQLCQALSLPIGSLFEAPDVQLIPLSAAPRINMGGSGADERLISSRAEDRIQVIRSSLYPEASGGDDLYTVSCEVELLHVISGTITIRLPDRNMELERGDSLSLPGRTPHTWHAGSEGAEIVWILVPAAWSGSA